MLFEMLKPLTIEKDKTEFFVSFQDEIQKSFSDQSLKHLLPIKKG
jgi:hypothetical protein